VRWQHIVESWNPNKYTVLHDLSLPRLLLLVVLAALGAVAVFTLLLIPTLLQTEASYGRLVATTDVRVDATFTQTEPVYLLRNPDVLVTTGEGDGFITVTPEGFSVKYFVFFGERTYPWLWFSDLDAFPARGLAFAAGLVLLPSALAWGTILILANLALAGLLYTFIAYFVLHVREYRVRYADLWKVTLFAGIPGMTVFALSPILRLGLPLAVIIGFVFVLWLVFSLLGTALVTHHDPGRASHR
jgi:hypothetical protein